MEHLQYKTSEPIKSLKAPLPRSHGRDADHSLPEQEHKIPEKINGIPNRIIDFIQGYRESYKNGIEKYGVWWKIFQLSIWGFVLIFLLTALIIVVVYLPKIEMIHWELR